MNWMDILGLGASAASGGLFGVLGAAFGAWMKLKERKQKAIEQSAEREHELKMMEAKMALVSQGASWDAMETSHRSEIALNGQDNYKWVVAIKSLFRPALTLFLWLAVGWQLMIVLTGTLTEYLTIAETKAALFTTEELTALVKYIVYSTVFSATTATTWWFGERALSLPDMKNR
jgi:hypothetical protein